MLLLSPPTIFDRDFQRDTDLSKVEILLPRAYSTNDTKIYYNQGRIEIWNPTIQHKYSTNQVLSRTCLSYNQCIVVRYLNRVRLCFYVPIRQDLTKKYNRLLSILRFKDYRKHCNLIIISWSLIAWIRCITWYKLGTHYVYTFYV